MGKDAVSINADTFAFFTRNPRGKAKDINHADVDALAAKPSLYIGNAQRTCKISLGVSALSHFIRKGQK